MTGGAEAIRAAAGAPELYALPGGKSDDGGQAQNLYLAEKERNDLGNGERLLARHGSDLLYVREIGPHVWSGTHWRRPGAEEEWRRRAHQTARSIMEEAHAKLKVPPPDYISGEDWKDDARKLMGWSVESGNGGRVSAMMREAQQYCSVGPTEMDAEKAFAEAMRERGQKKLNTRVRLYADVKLVNVPDSDDLPRESDGGDDAGYW